MHVSAETLIEGEPPAVVLIRTTKFLHETAATCIVGVPDACRDQGVSGDATTTFVRPSCTHMAQHDAQRE